MEREKLYRLLSLGIEKGASDIHFQVGYLPLYRFNGDLVELRYKVLTEKDTEAIARILAEADDKTFDEFNELDLAFELPSEGRFRVNISRQRRFCNIVLRVIPLQIRTFDELNLPSTLRDVARLQRGYVLVTGSTGMGKSTTLAAMVREINDTLYRNIITVEDPIEFLHRDNKSLINQREVGNDTKSFSEALRHVLRQDPDVILVAKSNAGMPELVDMRAVYRADPETMAAAALAMREAGASIVGGCCGTTPAHLEAMTSLVRH